MDARPQAFLPPSPPKFVNNYTISFSCLCYVSYPWKYMGEGKSCHSASHVSWDMQGLLFVLETQELY